MFRSIKLCVLTLSIVATSILVTPAARAFSEFQMVSEEVGGAQGGCSKAMINAASAECYRKGNGGKIHECSWDGDSNGEFTFMCGNGQTLNGDASFFVK